MGRITPSGVVVTIVQCRHCNALLMAPAGRRYCYAPECVKAESLRKKQSGREATRANRKRKRAQGNKTHHYRSLNKRTHDRKCLKCNEFCWPNYYYCPDCLSRLESGHNLSEQFIGVDGFLWKEEVTPRTFFKRGTQ